MINNLLDLIDFPKNSPSNENDRYLNVCFISTLY